jgi:hypothetical protein
MTTLVTFDYPVLAAGGNGDFSVVVVPFVILLAVGSLLWHFRRSRSLLDQWAEQNGLEILESDYRNFFKGPFFWTSSKGQTVYHVKVRDQEGKVRSGWVRCGGWLLGLLSDNAEVRWED